ncbi:tyrosine-type recombinase/integrase [Argonema galeatum]|uniref:tyrosine-type recombinase/integrase n=1 Tax=Argonema galeatum TaxID=2942762 RepID=UPI0020128CCC|nr:tyrosine-type recombinase/integrase [Argonema galeatum]MCL1464871.1 tyrosine-type recombinase/integrase [Argonema galeatum A003/A1]
MNISIERNGSRNLRLRWNCQGKRHCLSLGVEDTKSNRLKAERFKLQIEADIEDGTFDPTLAKYKFHPSLKKPIAELTSAELFQQWLSYKARFVDRRTIDWYRPALKHLEEYFGNLSASEISPAIAANFAAWLMPQAKPETVRRKLESCKAAWDWAMEQGTISHNPWVKTANLINLPAQEMPNPFTKEEVNLILEGFKSLYQPLYQFIRFLFGTGCRTGEARGLRWVDLSNDCRRCTISGQLSRTGRKPPKNRKSRVILLPDSLAAMLRDLKKESDESEYVFLWKGKPIEESRLYRRWKRVLRIQGVVFREPYNTRSTFISHALEAGMSPQAIAEQTGHSLKILFAHYAGYLQSSTKLPEIF